MKFYRLDKQEVYNAKTDIPSEQWERKQVLPYEINTVSIEQGTETDEVEGIEILIDKVVYTKIKYIIVPTLEESKVAKYKDISTQIHSFVTDKYPYYKQLSALNGTYSLEECIVITEFCDKYVKQAIVLKGLISAATTKEEVEAIYWRKVIFIDEMSLEISGYEYNPEVL